MIRRLLTAVWFVSLLYPHFLLAQGTKLWLQSKYDEFEKGQPQGVSIASSGYLEAGPEFRSVILTPSTVIWAVASDSHGNAYLATGSPATVLKISPEGASTKLFSTKDLSVQSVQVGSDGAVYAATLPSGKVYKILPNQSDLDESTAAVIFDPAHVSSKANEQPKYIWALALDAQGVLYIATGGPAAIYRVNVSSANAKPELFFSSDEQHIRCLFFESNGDLIAGSDGSGLVYRIGKDGKGIVLYDAPKREVTALTGSANGQLYVAAVGEKTKSSLPPLPVQGNAVATATITIVTPGSVQASSTNTLVPDGSEVDELNAQGAPRKLWASRDDVIYSLRSTAQGLVVATGNRGRVYRVQEDGSYSDVAHVSAGQATALAAATVGTYVATSNAGRLYMLADKPASNSTYVSDVFDSGVFSGWGRAEVNANDGGPSGPFELFVRSGNVDNPERDWNPWQKVTPNGPSMGIPSARFVQWKAVLEPGARLSSVGINYLPVNTAPVMDEVFVQTGARVNQAAQQLPQPQQITINLPSTQTGPTYTQDPATQPLPAFKDRTAVTARWVAHDDNGDELLFDIYYRGDGEKNWRLLKSRVSERFFTFDSALLPDGGYRLKVVATDAASHLPGEALTGQRESDHFVIDTTSPSLSPLRATMEGGKVHAVFEATDSTSPITRAEYSLDAGPWQYLEPVGKLSDSPTEHYDFSVPLKAQPADDKGVSQKIGSDPNEHVLAVRVYDRYDNVNAAKTVVH